MAFGLHAFAKVDGATGVISSSVNFVLGIRMGVGVYTLLFDSAIDDSQANIMITPVSAMDVSCVKASGAFANSVLVRAFNSAGVWADVDFDIAVYRIRI